MIFWRKFCPDLPPGPKNAEKQHFGASFAKICCQPPQTLKITVQEQVLPISAGMPPKR